MRTLPRIGLHALALATVVVVVFALPRAMPGDPLDTLGGGGADFRDPVIHAQLQKYYGLNRPLASQFVRYLGQLARGDLGTSVTQHVAVSSLVRERLPWTLLLVGTALVLSSLCSFVLGMAAGWRHRSSSGRFLVVATTGVSAVPGFALATLLLVGLAVAWPLFPVSGAQTPFAHYGSPLAAVGDVARHLALPALALGLPLVGTNVLLVRNTVVGALGRDYLTLARAKGLPERTVKWRHAGRNALLPFVTVVGTQVGFAVGGAVFVESVFGYPGMGSLVLQAVADRDYPVLNATLLLLAMVVLAVNLAVDLLYRRLDPTTTIVAPR
ncbi:MAG TPA: ABC transporter permease [Acidimicrobiales bacterium]|nr:ABC transporter permease [Acidimicrobiales bacterium]